MNILPTRYVELKDTLLYSGAVLLNELSNPKSVSKLWQDTKESDCIYNFRHFVAALDMLYIMGLVDLKNEKIVKVIL